MYIEGGEWTREGIAKRLSLLHNTQENVQCVMGYIVNLTLILYDISKTAAGSVTENAALKAMNSYIKSSRRNSVHQDIRSFVTDKFPIRFATPQKDLVLEKIIDLIGQYCVPPPG